MVLLILINFTSYGKLCDLGNWESFGTPLIIADLHNISPNLTPAVLASPIKLLPQTPPAANWLRTFVMKLQEQLWALGILCMVLTWPLPPASSEALRRVNGVTKRHREVMKRNGKHYTPSSDCLPDPRQTWYTWTPSPCGKHLSKIRLLHLLPFYMVYGHFLMLCCSLSQQLSAGASLTLPLPLRFIVYFDCLGKARFCIFIPIPSK